MEKNIYSAPQVEVVELFAEGILCESGLGASNETWEEQDFGW